MSAASKTLGLFAAPDMPALPAMPVAPKPIDPTLTFANAIAAQKRRTASGMNGRNSTLLTGPAGDTGGAPLARQTLLGD